jgi:AraC-like DNA-binding protein
MGLRIPRRLIAPLVPNVDEAAKRLAIPRASAATLLAKYIDTVADDRSTLAPEFSRLITQHIYDLVGLLLSANRDTTEFVKQRGVRAARLHIIKADIAASLGDCNLNVVKIAARQGATPRYVQKLFETEGTTFSAFVLRERLAKAYRTLSDPRYLDRRISSVAFESGFGDLSHFNHCFRRYYGATPSDVRAEVRTSMPQNRQVSEMCGNDLHRI